MNTKIDMFVAFIDDTNPNVCGVKYSEVDLKNIEFFSDEIKQNLKEHKGEIIYHHIKRISLDKMYELAKSEIENAQITSFNLYLTIHETSDQYLHSDYIFEGISAINAPKGIS